MKLEFSGQMWFWRGPVPRHFVVPVKASVRKAEALDLGDTVSVCLTVDT